MDEPRPHATIDFSAHDDSFCRYLTKQLIAKHGFVEGAPQAAADIDGAIGGTLVGFALLALCPRNQPRLRLSGGALAAALGGLALWVTAGALARASFPVYELSAALMPSASFPTTDDAQRRQSADLVARYPRDPRAQPVRRPLPPTCARRSTSRNSAAVSGARFLAMFPHDAALVDCAKMQDRLMSRFALLVVLTALLSGCFTSDRPMFAPDSAARAVGDGGKYATFEQVDGKEQPSDPVEIRPRGPNGYDFVDEKGVATPVTFHALPDGRYVAQAKLEGDQGYGYLIARIDGPQIVVTPIECLKQDDARMAALGVVKRSQYECRIDAVADPVAFFTALKPNPAVSRMVRQ